MKKKWVVLLIVSIITAILIGCTAQDKETMTQEKAQKQTEKEAEKQQEKEEKQAKEKAEKEQKVQEKAKKDEENKEKKFKEDVEKIVKKAVGKSDVESVEINKNFDLPDPNNKVVLLNLKNANDKILTWNDTTKILKKLSKEKEIQKVIFIWRAEFTDTYGNKTNDPVMKMKIDRENLDKINFDNFDYKNIPNVVQDYWEHSAYNKK